MVPKAERIAAARLELWSGVRQDVAYAVRLYWRHRATLLTAVGGVALALTLAGGVLAAVTPTVFPRIGVADPDSLVSVSSGDPWTYDDFRAVSASVSDLPLAAWTRRAMEIRSGHDMLTRTATVAFVSGNFLDVIGASAHAGRLLHPDDEVPGRTDVAVLSYDAWTRLFGRDPSILGTTLSMGGRPVTMVGVAEARFTGPLSHTSPAVWLPLAHLAERRESGAGIFALVYARIGQDGAGERLRARVGNALEQRRQANPTGPSTIASGGEQAWASPPGLVQVTLRPVRSSAGPSSGAALPLLLVLLLALVLMALANFGGSLLALATARDRELAARLALGASRARLARQLLTESLLLGTGAAVVCVFALYVGLPLLANVLALPLGLDLSTDGRIHATVSLAAALVAIAGGLSPVQYLFGLRVRSALAGTSNRQSRPERLRAVMVGLQVGLAVLCLISATTLARGASRARGVDVGFDFDKLLALTGSSVGLNWTPPEAAAYWETALARVEGMPGVLATAFATQVYGLGYRGLRVRAGNASHDVVINRTSSDYFATAGLSLVRGRAYTEAEVRAGAPVGVISLRLARALGGPDTALGSTLRPARGNEPPARVIGIVDDVIGSTRGVAELSEPVSTLYRPLATSYLPTASLVVRTDSDRMALKRDLERVLPAFLPDRPPRFRVVGFDLAGQIERAQRPARLATLAGTALVLLTVVGLHGLLSLVVRLREKELAVRRALGAGWSAVAWAASRPAVIPAICGIAFGVLTAIATMRRIEPALYGVPSFDPWSWGAAIALLLAALAAGVFRPLVRLRRLEPAEVLKAE